MIDSQLAHTISYSFFFFASESGHHTDDIGYTLSMHTDTHTTCLPYHTIDSPFFFPFLFHGFPTLVIAKMDDGTAHRIPETMWSL